VLPLKNVEFEKKLNFQFLTAHLSAPTKVKFGVVPQVKIQFYFLPFHPDAPSKAKFGIPLHQCTGIVLVWDGVKYGIYTVPQKVLTFKLCIG